MNEDLELELRFRSCSLDDSSSSRQVPASVMPALQVDAPGNNASFVYFVLDIKGIKKLLNKDKNMFIYFSK